MAEVGLPGMVSWHPTLATLSIRYQNSRPQNGWLWPIDQAGHLVPFRQQPPRSVEFGAVLFGVPTIRQPFVLPPREWLQ